MKKIRDIIISSFLLVLISHPQLNGQTLFKAGAARVNITPPLGTIINGDFLPMYAKEIHDSLYAKALAFENGKDKFVFIVVDNMTLDAVLINDAKAKILSKTGLLPTQVMISCTHAHSTGSVIETANRSGRYELQDSYAEEDSGSSRGSPEKPSAGQNCLGANRCSEACQLQEMVYEAWI